TRRTVRWKRWPHVAVQRYVVLGLRERTPASRSAYVGSYFRLVSPISTLYEIEFGGLPFRPRYWTLNRKSLSKRRLAPSDIEKRRGLPSWLFGRRLLISTEISPLVSVRDSV